MLEVQKNPSKLTKFVDSYIFSKSEYNHSFLFLWNSLFTKEKERNNKSNDWKRRKNNILLYLWFINFIDIFDIS